jgi:Druantia protein DruA
VFESQVIQGRRITAADIADIARLIAAHPAWSRWRLSRVLAQQWDWRNAAGQLKDMAARTLLLKLNQRQLIRLPECRRRPCRRGPCPTPELFDALMPASLAGELSQVLPLEVQVVGPKHPDYHLFQQYLVQHHYLSYGGPVGENLGYLVRSCQAQPLACVLFGAAAWQCAPRDQWIGWSAAQRAQGLHFIANNSRFLVLPWVHVKSLASRVLSQISRRIDADWQGRYGHPLHLLETFVQQDRFPGTCYKAANWIHVGRTTGRTRQDRHNRVNAPFKDIYLYPLTAHARPDLCR